MRKIKGYKVLLRPQEGSERYEQGILKYVVAHCSSKKRAIAYVNRLNENGLNAWVETEYRD